MEICELYGDLESMKELKSDDASKCKYVPYFLGGETLQMSVQSVEFPKI